MLPGHPASAAAGKRLSAASTMAHPSQAEGQADRRADRGGDRSAGAQARAGPRRAHRMVARHRRRRLCGERLPGAHNLAARRQGGDACRALRSGDLAAILLRGRPRARAAERLFRLSGGGRHPHRAAARAASAQSRGRSRNRRLPPIRSFPRPWSGGLPISTSRCGIRCGCSAGGFSQDRDEKPRFARETAMP